MSHVDVAACSSVNLPYLPHFVAHVERLTAFLAYSCGANRMEILDKGPLGSRMASEGCQYPITDLCLATTAQNVVDHLL